MRSDKDGIHKFTICVDVSRRRSFWHLFSLAFVDLQPRFFEVPSRLRVHLSQFLLENGRGRRFIVHRFRPFRSPLDVVWSFTWNKTKSPDKRLTERTKEKLGENINQSKPRLANQHFAFLLQLWPLTERRGREGESCKRFILRTDLHAFLRD